MLKGTSPDGSHYFPAFPYTSYQRMRIEDVRDLFAYLKTLPAVQGKVRDHDLPFPFNMRRIARRLEIPLPRRQAVQARSTKSAQWNRGAYLVNGPGHCAECHSPRNALGGIVASQRFAGGPNPEGGDGWVPNITQAGIGDYSERDIERILETGDTPNGDSVGGPMAPVDRQHLAAPSRGSRRDGGLHQVAAAGRRAEAAVAGIRSGYQVSLSGRSVSARRGNARLHAGRAGTPPRRLRRRPRHDQFAFPTDRAAALRRRRRNARMNVLKAIPLKLMSAFLFAVMSALVRFLGETYPVGQIVFFRSAFAILPVVLIYAWRGELAAAVRTVAPVRAFRARA